MPLQHVACDTNTAKIQLRFSARSARNASTRNKSAVGPPFLDKKKNQIKWFNSIQVAEIIVSIVDTTITSRRNAKAINLWAALRRSLLRPARDSTPVPSSLLTADELLNSALARANAILQLKHQRGVKFFVNGAYQFRVVGWAASRRVMFSRQSSTQLIPWWYFFSLLGI